MYAPGATTTATSYPMPTATSVVIRMKPTVQLPKRLRLTSASGAAMPRMIEATTRGTTRGTTKAVTRDPVDKASPNDPNGR